MATLKFENIGITAVAACVPKRVVRTEELEILDNPQKTIDATGIHERRVADAGTCASDLCLAAAQQLIKDNAIDPQHINALIFVSQTPDYRQPATSMMLQAKLGMSRESICFDVNLACSGYVYGLSIAYAFANLVGIDNVLLLAGDTLTKTISHKDRVTYPLFGDAGTATLVSKIDKEQAFFSLNSDGEQSAILNIPFGGYRNPSCQEGLIEVEDSDGNIRTGEHLKMDGIEVFAFGLREAPKDVRKVMAFAGISVDQIDRVYFHQANRLMNDLIAKKLKIEASKLAYSLEKFGNTSSSSIPLTMAVCDHGQQPGLSLICGFGAGLSWATALIDLKNANISKPIEL